MNLVLHIPDDFAERLGGDVERRALEGLAVEAFRLGRLSKAELRRLLWFETRARLDGFLKDRGVFEPYSSDDLEQERSDLRRLGL